MPRSKPYVLKLVAHNPGERGVGIPETWVDLKLSIDDEYFDEDPEFAERFERDFKKFMKSWLDAREIWTEAELKELERREAEAEKQMERAEAEWARRGR